MYCQDKFRIKILDIGHSTTMWALERNCNAFCALDRHVRKPGLFSQSTLGVGMLVYNQFL